MSIACPSCKAGLNPKGLKPGKYQPKCPKCQKPFLLVVPVDPAATVSVQPVAAPKPAPVSAPAAAAKPIKKPLDPEEVAARLLAGEDVDGFADDGPSAAEATGNFTEPEPSPPPAPKKAPAPQPPRPATPAAPRPAAKPVAKAADPNATGDFTEPEAASAPPRPASKPIPKPPVRKADPNATGDFTEPLAASPARKPVDPGATGDFTEPMDEEPDRTAASGASAGGYHDRTSAVESGPGVDGDRTAASDADEDFSVGAKSKPTAVKKPAPDVDDDADAPDRLGGYEVLKVLGKGGMGAVLLGRQISLDRKVALKVMHPRIAQNPTFVARFTREAYAAAQLTHHNVIQIYDIGEDRGQHFFSMEFVTGQSLGDVVKSEGKLTPELAVGYVLQAARGLRYGHLQGMVHRDIKPDNLMVNTEGIVKVADLGLVKLPAAGTGPQDEATDGTGEDAPAGLTRVGAVMGTPAYMPPEQARDSGSVDQRADIYSLGCTLYVLLTGRPPFAGKTALEIISKHQTEPLVPPEVVVKRVPKALSAILLRMMAKKPEDRYQSMDEVIAALEGFLGVDRTGPFNPTEEQADRLEKCTHQFNYRSKGKTKALLAGGFFLACLLGVAGAAFAGMPALAGGLVGLAVMTPAAYFLVHGLLSGGVVFPRARAFVFGLKLTDWLIWAAGGLLFLATLFLFGLLWAWLGFAVLAVGLGFLLWALTDRPQARAQAPILAEARDLFRTMRLAGLGEDALHQFVCKFSGASWEPFYEAHFGYEAKLAARAYRKGNTGEPSKTAGTWREPVVGWIEARLDARRRAGERKHLRAVEAKALEAEGVSRAEAKAQAEAMAADLVDQAAGVKAARKEGKETSVKDMVAAARERRRPKPGYNIAGKKLRSLWLKDFLNDWFGRRLRFVLGGVVFAAGLLWMYQNDLLGRGTGVVDQLVALDFEAAGKGLTAAAGRPLRVSFLPPAVTAPVNSYAVPLTGFLLMLSGVFYFGWRPSLTAVPGAVIGVLGPTLGVPEVGPLGPPAVSLVIAAVLIVVASRFLRE